MISGIIALALLGLLASAGIVMFILGIFSRRMRGYAFDIGDYFGDSSLRWQLKKFPKKALSAIRIFPRRRLLARKIMAGIKRRRLIRKTRRLAAIALKQKPAI